MTGARAIRRCAACAACLVCVADVAGGQGPRAEAAGVRRLALSAQNGSPGEAALPVFRAPAADVPRELSQTSPVEESQDRPSLEPARLAGQVLAGAYAGIGGYFLTSWVGGLVMNTMPASDRTKDQVQFALGLVGATAATAASVSAIGNIGDQTGSYRAALAGTAGGVAVGVILNQLLYGHARLPSEEGSSRVRWLEASLEALLPSIGATIAFNSTRKYK